MINAYSTVRDEVPGEYTQQRSILDPAAAVDMDQHLQGFMNYVWDRGGGEMTQILWALLEHIRNTRRQYVFDRTDLDGLDSWAVQANAIFFLPDGRVVDAAGRDLIVDARAPFHPDAQARATRVRGELQARGFGTPQTLPPVPSEKEAIVREPAEVAQRMLSLVAISEVAGFYGNGEEPPIDAVQGVLPRAFDGLTPQERRALELMRAGDRGEEAQHLALQVSWGVAAAGMLAYALGHAFVDLQRLTTLNDDLVPWVAESGEQGVLAECTSLRPLGELCDTYELVRSLRWVAVDESLRDGPATIDEMTAGTLLEWHRALGWLFETESEWDEVNLST